MESLQELTEILRSKDAVERVEARVKILKNFSTKFNETIKNHVVYGLIEDIKANRKQIADYVLGIEDVNQKSYLIMAVDRGLVIDENNVPPYLTTQKEIRKDFIRGVETITENLHHIKDYSSRLATAEIITREGHEKQALIALKQTWDIGWDTKIKNIFSNTDEGITTIAGSLETTLDRTALKSVKEKALEYLSEIQDANIRKRYLIRAMTSEDQDLALKALEIYNKKISPSKDRLKDMIDIATGCKRGRNSEIETTTNYAVISKAFDEYIENIPTDERLSKICYFITEEFMSLIEKKKLVYSEELEFKIVDYIGNHIEDVKNVENKKERARLLWEVAIRGDDNTSLKAVNYLTETDNPKEGLENIAYMYTFELLEEALPERSRKKIEKLVMKHTREFFHLENKQLALKTLSKIHREYSNKRCIDKKTGKKYGDIAREELNRIVTGFRQYKGLRVINFNR